MKDYGDRPGEWAVDRLDIPELLHTSVRRNSTNLARLFATLKYASMPKGQIESGVATIVDSYKTELLVAIRTLRGTAHA